MPLHDTGSDVATYPYHAIAAFFKIKLEYILIVMLRLSNSSALISGIIRRRDDRGVGGVGEGSLDWDGGILAVEFCLFIRIGNFMLVMGGRP